MSDRQKAVYRRIKTQISRLKARGATPERLQPLYDKLDELAHGGIKAA